MKDLIQRSTPLTMSSREIAELVESRHDNVKRTVERLAERGVIQLPPLEEVKNHLGQTIEEYHLVKRDSYVVVAQLSPEFTARLVDRWQELEEAQVRTPAAKEIPSAVGNALAVARGIIEMLHLEGSARLAVVAQVAKAHAPEMLPAIPAYAIDAPSTSLSGSSYPTKAVTHLLADFGIKTSAIAFNQRLADAGLQERMERPRNGKKPDKFWAVTEKGLAFGKNIVNPNNPRETQPHWFVHTFQSLLDYLDKPSQSLRLVK